jgi:hypothetical protein
VTSDNSHYSIVKELLPLSTERRNFNPQGSAYDDRPLHQVAGLENSSFKRANQCHGGGEGIRTPDPMVANHVLCQLSYTPDKIADFRFLIADCSMSTNQHKIGNRKSAIENQLRLVAGAGFEPATFGL